MKKTVTAALIALAFAGTLAGCTSTTVSDPAPEKVPSVSALFTSSPDLAPAFADLTQKPFVADGVGATDFAFVAKKSTESLTIFVSCATSSKYSFTLLDGATDIGGNGAGDDCKGANTAGYGVNLKVAPTRPNSIRVVVGDDTSVELTVYESAEKVKAK